jgi:hypothetical protein
MNFLRLAKSILIEINDDFREQATMSRKIQESHGFKQVSKEQSYLVKNTEFSNSYNQIWEKIT